MASDWSSMPQGGGTNAGIVSDHEHSLAAAYGRIQTSTLDRPPLRSHKSFPYALGTSNFASPHTQSPLSQVTNPAGSDELPPPDSELKLRDDAPQEISVQMSFGGSAPASPVPQLTPTSVDEDQKELMEAAGDIEDDIEEQDELREDVPREKTAAERRAEKRKMKRFRLTHNQTRFLMSEFARQAHPDAAQRDRLSREIPGLSPRQVQVWFQNRRAKLKRLTNDDRERIMKSRALPEDFDMTQALHSPFAATSSGPFTSQPHATPLASPAGYPPYDGGILRPLHVSGLRRESEDDATISPINMPSAYSQFFTPPASVAASDTLSPVSPTNDRTPFMAPSYAQPSPRTSGFWGNRSGSFSNYHASHNVPRLQLHDRIGRSRAESLASPLRTSMSYTGNLDHATTTTEPTLAQQATGSQQAKDYWSEMPVGQANTNYNAVNFPSSSVSRQGGPINTTFPPGLNLRHQSRSLQPFSSIQNLQQHDNRQQSTAQPAYQSLQQPQTSQASQPVFYGTSQAQVGDLSSSGAAAASQGIYAMQYADPENDNINTFGTSGVTNEPTSAPAIEPESYYKSEPYGSRLAGGLGFGGARPHSNSFGAANMPPHQGAIPRSNQPHLHQQNAPPIPQNHQQAAQRSPRSPFGVGMKRRRDSLEAGSEPDASTAEYEGGSRKRSYTMPGGFRGALGP